MINFSLCCYFCAVFEGRWSQKENLSLVEAQILKSLSHFVQATGVVTFRCQKKGAPTVLSDLLGYLAWHFRRSFVACVPEWFGCLKYIEVANNDQAPTANNFIHSLPLSTEQKPLLGALVGAWRKVGWNQTKLWTKAQGLHDGEKSVNLAMSQNFKAPWYI